jgi:hypothetical protein
VQEKGFEVSQTQSGRWWKESSLSEWMSNLARNVGNAGVAGVRAGGKRTGKRSVVSVSVSMSE